MSFMMAFGWVSVMLCIGMVLRAKISIFRNMLVPSSVIAGILGMIFINIMENMGIGIGTNAKMFTEIVNNLFTVSFISISLTNAPKDEGNTAKNIMKGAVALGLVWCLLYALTPLAAFGLAAWLGKSVKMEPVYGMLVQFAFCQGPGQAAAYGSIFEQFGWENSSMVAVIWAAIGFIAAFLGGIPVAKLGIKKGLATHCGKIDNKIRKGYLKKEEQVEQMVKDTTCNSNVETLAFHFALIGICYILAVGISRILAYLPGFLGTSMSSMMFMNGMYAAYIIRWLLKKLHLDFLQENVLQSKITGWTSDYLVICAFMAISLEVILPWIVPILLISVVITLITFLVCFYFGQRFGGKNDFERMLGLYGTCTGTVPSGITLIRIVDPNFETTTSIELGACNLVMMASTPVYIIILALASGTIGVFPAIISLSVCSLIYLVLLKITGLWGEKTFSWSGHKTM